LRAAAPVDAIKFREKLRRKASRGTVAEGKLAKSKGKRDRGKEKDGDAE